MLVDYNARGRIFLGDNSEETLNLWSVVQDTFALIETMVFVFLDLPLAILGWFGISAVPNCCTPLVSSCICAGLVAVGCAGCVGIGVGVGVGVTCAQAAAGNSTFANGTNSTTAFSSGTAFTG